MGYSQSRHGRILVVDDDPKMLKLLDLRLKSEGYEVIPANGGHQAINKLEQSKPDMALVDVNMPGMSGLELLVELKRKAPGLPVVIMTAYSSEDVAVTALKRHADGYITKPFHAQEISQIVQENIQQCRGFSAYQGFLDKSPSSPVGLIHQISKLEHAKRLLEEDNVKLREQSIRDGLTGLYNHTHFQERLEAEFERSQRYNTNLSLVMIDVDNFKDVNDLYGHQEGDKVLIQLAKLMLESIRSIDIAARYGGEEFALILPQINAKGTRHMAERLGRRVQEYFSTLYHLPLKLTISQGIAAIPHPDIKTKAGIIRAADQALYEAKHHNKNCVNVYAGCIFAGSKG